MNKIIIAIDGTSSSGKSTISKAIAKSLDLIHIDSGAMYRAVTFYAVSNNLDSDSLIKNLNKISIDFKKNKLSETNEVYLNNINVEKEIRTENISKKVSQIAKIIEVRNFLTELQRNFAMKNSIVMDGRDIGTNVFPQATIKFYISSSIEVRANRRFKQLNSENSLNLEKVKRDLIERDLVDSTRKDSPLKKAEDAIEIDNSNATKEETIKIISDIIKERLKIN